MGSWSERICVPLGAGPEDVVVVAFVDVVDVAVVFETVGTDVVEVVTCVLDGEVVVFVEVTAVVDGDGVEEHGKHCE